MSFDDENDDDEHNYNVPSGSYMCTKKNLKINNSSFDEINISVTEKKIRIIPTEKT